MAHNVLVVLVGVALAAVFLYAMRAGVVLLLMAGGAYGGFVATRAASAVLFRRASGGRVDGGCLTLIASMVGGVAGLAATYWRIDSVLSVFS